MADPNLNTQPQKKYYEQGLDYLANMGDFAQVVEDKAQQVKQRKTYIAEYITQLNKGIEDIQKLINVKIVDVEKIDGKFDDLIEGAIGKQQDKLKDLYKQLAEISNFQGIVKELSTLKDSVNSIGSIVNPQVTVNPIDTNEVPFGDLTLPLQTPQKPVSGGSKKRKGGHHEMMGGYTYGKLRKKSKKTKKKIKKKGKGKKISFKK